MEMIKEKVFNPKFAPQHQTILDATSDLIVAFDRDYQVAYCNLSFKKNLEIFTNESFDENKNLDEYIGLSRFDDLSSRWIEWMERCFNGEKFKDTVEYRIIGKKITYVLEFIPVIINNEITYVQLSAKEDTLRKNYEELLKQQKNQINENQKEAESDPEKERIIQERDDALNLLIENAERLQIVLEGSNDGIWDWNIEKDEFFYNSKLYEIYGYRKGELKADFKSWEKLIHEDDVNDVVEKLHAHMEGNSDQFISEHRIITKHGECKWVMVKGKVAVRDENSNPLRVAGTLNDIDERKKIEKALQESEAKFVSMTENLPVMIWVTDKKIKPVYANKKAKEFVGEDHLNKKIDYYVHNDDLEFFRYNVLRSIRKKEVNNCELRMKDGKDNFRWVYTNVVPRYSENDEFIGVLGVGSDITERKEIETKLLESETQFTEITSVIGDGIFMIDSEMNFKFANPEFFNLLGYSENELEDLNIQKIMRQHINDNNEKAPISHVIETGESIRITEDYFLTKDQEVLPVSYVGSPLRRNEEIIGCVVAFHDITERLNAQEEMNRFVEELQYNKELMEENANEFARVNEMLAESQESLQELNASKDKFFSIISHDLRSPFTSIIGFAEVMLEDLDTLSKEDIKDFTNSIYKSSKNIQNLLENLLQWSRVQTGRIEFNPISFDLREISHEVVALYQVNAARKKINLFCEIENHYKITADKFMIDTVLRNLVSNSIKFTKHGGEIKINAVPQKENKEILISVEDTGVGMTETTLNKLFKIDEHVTHKGTDKEKGTGLGLILCKEFVEKHNGTIWVESILGEGSKFKFSIPYQE